MKELIQNDSKKQKKLQSQYLLLCACGASLLTRHCSNEAFKKNFRGTTTPDLIERIPYVFEKLFPHEKCGKVKKS